MNKHIRIKFAFMVISNELQELCYVDTSSISIYFKRLHFYIIIQNTPSFCTIQTAAHSLLLCLCVRFGSIFSPLPLHLHCTQTPTDIKLVSM